MTELHCNDLAISKNEVSENDSCFLVFSIITRSVHRNLELFKFFFGYKCKLEWFLEYLHWLSVVVLRSCKLVAFRYLIF